MSTDAPENDNQVSEVSDDERELFERIAERHEGEDVGRIAEIVLQSLSSEEAN